MPRTRFVRGILDWWSLVLMDDKPANTKTISKMSQIGMNSDFFGHIIDTPYHDFSTWGV